MTTPTDDAHKQPYKEHVCLSPLIRQDVPQRWYNVSHLRQADQGAGLVSKGKLQESHGTRGGGPPKTNPLAIQANHPQWVWQTGPEEFFTFIGIGDHVYLIVTDVQ